MPYLPDSALAVIYIFYPLYSNTVFSVQGSTYTTMDVGEGECSRGRRGGLPTRPTTSPTQHTSWVSTLTVA